MFTELSNLVLMRNSTLGQSAPSLSNSLVCTNNFLFPYDIFGLKYKYIFIFRENYMLQDVEDVQTSQVKEKVSYLIHHLRYQDVTRQCQVNNSTMINFYM